MNTQKKMAIAFISLVIILAILVSSITSKVSSSIKKAEEKYEKHIGKEYILDKDTLTIIDYSILDETLILSNGTSINYKLIK